MAAALDLIYWDACIFYEYCRADQPDPYKRQAVDDILAANRDRRNRICTSIITHAEVVPSKLGPGVDDRYWACFGSSYFFDIEIDRPVVLLAREIRDFYRRDASDPGGYRLMGMGDAVHLATAIIHSATEFHTRDAKRSGGNVPLVGLDVSSPNGRICGAYELKIVNPVASQIPLV